MPDNLDYKIKYYAKLPHIQPGNTTIFVTFRLAGSLPKHIINKLLQQDFENKRKLMMDFDPINQKEKCYLEQKRQFARWDQALAESSSGPNWMNQKEIAELVSNALHFLDNQKYSLISFCIMPNHVHIVFTPLKKEDESYHALPAIMHSIKSYTGNNANKILNRKGAFWNHESYDHVARDEVELNNIIQYVINNPKKAGLVERWEDWQWTYLGSKQSRIGVK